MENIYFWILLAIWIVTLVVAFIIEIESLEPIGAGLFAGAVVALIIHAFIGRTALWWIQLLLFVIIWIAIWFVFIKLGIQTTSNLKDEFIGKTVEATKGNDEKYGEVRFNDKVFRFKSEDKVSVGDKVKILKLTGVTMIVSKSGGGGYLKAPAEKGDK